MIPSSATQKFEKKRKNPESPQMIFFVEKFRNFAKNTFRKE
jgi:hypothetical protein